MAGALIIAIFVQNTGVYNNQQAKITQGLNINDAITNINSNIRQSYFVADSYPIQNPLYNSNQTTLILALPSLDQNSNPIDQKYDYVVTSPDSSNPQILREQLFPDPLSSRSAYSKVLTSNLLSISFTYTNDSKVPVSPNQASLVLYTLNLSNTQGAQIIQSSASGQTRIRNI